jgi:ABC-type Fe3+/spermidine/putrescine transport system ATPase subunit
MSDRIAVMGKGNVQQIGSGPELFDKPQSSYVAQFLGINTFQAKAAHEVGECLEVRANGNTLYAPVASHLVGISVIGTIKTENITLQKTKPPPTEANNVLEGTITEMVMMRSTAQVTLDVGFSLKARVPLVEIKRLGVSVGDSVFACFSADSLNVFVDSEGN